MCCKARFKLTLCMLQFTQKLSKQNRRFGLRREIPWIERCGRDEERTMAEGVGCIRPTPLSGPNMIKTELTATTELTFNQQT